MTGAFGSTFMRQPRRARVRILLAVVGTLACGAVITGGVVSPSWAESAQRPGGAEPAVLGGFALGDGVEGMVDPRSGAFSFALPVAGVSLGWDSRAAGVDRSGLGDGWSMAGVAQVETEGGVRVSPASGGVFLANASVPSGLEGYLLGDVVFRQGQVQVPASADGSRGAVEAAFELIELGGVRTFFSAAGDPVVRVDANGNRSDWSWEPGHRLVRATDVSGVTTTLDWSDPGRVLVTTAAGVSQVTGAVELDGGRVSAVVDATGGRVQVGYTPAGLVGRFAGVSGAATEVSWQRLGDGQTAVDRVRVIEQATGTELSVRQWTAAAGLASGWPAQQVPTVAGSGVAGSAAEGFATAVTDGSSTVVSEFDGLGLLVERDIQVTTRSGSLVVQEQEYTYPDTDEGVSAQYAQPTGVTVTHSNADGGQREASETFEFDELGRLITQIDQDGTITETQFDSEVATDELLPVGLPVVQRVTAPDGLVAETRHELNANRTAHVATETYSGTVDGELTRTGRQEFDVDPDGFVSAERTFPQGGAGTPIVTTHTNDADLTAGTVTTTATVAAGTASEATSTQVVDAVHGGVLEETGPSGAKVSAAYDAAGRPVEQIDPAGNTTRFEYRTVQQHGQNATVVTGPDEVVTTTRMDVLGRVAEVTDNILEGEATPGHVRRAETREYPEPGMVRVTDAWGAASTKTQDLYGRTVKSVAANGLTELTIHDDVANTVTTGVTPTGNLADAEITSTAQLNDRGQAAETSGTRADGAAVPTTATTFDGLGRVTETVDEAGTTSVDLDPFGNPETTTITPANPTDAEGDPSAAPMTATRAFDGFGASTAKTLADGHDARKGGVLTYDELGRARSRTDQAGGTSSQEYAPDGLVTVATTSYGQVTRNEYDPDTRALTSTETTSPIGETVATGYDYDPVTGNVIGVFDPTDRANTEIRYEYDAWGNVTRTTYPDGSVIEHEYDEHGRQTATTDIAGNTTRYQHDATGLVTTATQTDPAGDLLAEVDYRYDAYGRMIEQARSNGIRTAYTYTSANQISSETATRADGTVVTERAYVYDERGNLLTRTDTRPGTDTGHRTGTDVGAPATTTTAYRYDAYDRLTDSAVHDGPTTDAPALSSTRYELTVGGDIHAEHRTDESGATTSRVFAYGPTGTMTGVTTTNPDGTVTTQAQEYDPAGNLTLALDGTRYAYDATNQPVTETTPDGVTIRTGYWASGQRAGHARDDTGAETTFHWDGSALLNDTHTGPDPAGPEASVTAAYLLGVGRHARTLADAASTVFYEADFHGNVTELTGPDANVTTSYDYTDYGLTTTYSGPGDEPDPGSLIGDAHRNPFQYAGEYTDPTGTQHLQARTYDPASMRLSSVDPEPQHNRYHYAALNPITLADPTGRIPALPTWATAVLAGVGAVLALTGFGTAISAVATANAIGAMTIGAKAVLVGTALAAAYDLTATTLDTIDVFMPEFLDDQTALILGATSLGAGAATAVAGIATRALTRVDINRALALGPDVAEGEARHLVEWAGRIAKGGQAKLSKFGITANRRDLARSLNDRIVEDLRNSEPGWTYSGHRAELEKFDSIVKDWDPPQPVRPSAKEFAKNIGAKKVHVDSGLGQRMRNVVAADEFAALWQSRALTTRVRDERDSLARVLASSQKSTALGQDWLYPRGVDQTGVYVPGYRFVDQDGDVMWDNHFFGWGVRWKYQHRAAGHEV